MEREAHPEHSQQPLTADEVKFLERSQHLADRSFLVIVIGLPLGAAAFLAAYFGGHSDLETPIVVVTIGLELLATPLWIIGNLRAEAAFNRVLPPEPQPRPALWRYVLPIAVALAYGSAFVLMPGASRLLWYGFFGIGVVAFLVAESQRRRRRSASRTRHTRIRRVASEHHPSEPPEGRSTTA